MTNETERNKCQGHAGLRVVHYGHGACHRTTYVRRVAVGRPMVPGAYNKVVALRYKSLFLPSTVRVNTNAISVRLSRVCSTPRRLPSQLHPLQYLAITGIMNTNLISKPRTDRVRRHTGFIIIIILFERKNKNAITSVYGRSFSFTPPQWLSLFYKYYHRHCIKKRFILDFFRSFHPVPQIFPSSFVR